MNRETFEHTIQQHITAFGIQNGTCIVCGDEGPIIPHVSRVGMKEYTLCESCAHRVWLREQAEA